MVTYCCFEEVGIEDGDGTYLNEGARGGCCMMRQRQAWTVVDYAVLAVAAAAESVVLP